MPVPAVNNDTITAAKFSLLRFLCGSVRWSKLGGCVGIRWLKLGGCVGIMFVYFTFFS